MKRHVIGVLLIAAIVMLGMPRPASVRAAAEPDPFLTMLGITPDNADVRADMLTYIDYRALEVANGAAKPGPGFDLKSVEGRAWTHSLLRVIAGPSLDSLVFQIARMADAVGFGPFDVDRAVTFGKPPRKGLIFGGTFDAGKIGTALKARNFEQKDVEGVPVWYRFDDSAMSVKDAEPADPFGGKLGQAARIGLLPGIIVESPVWDVVTPMITTFQKKTPAILDGKAYHVLAGALTDSTVYSGQLLQAVFFPVDLVKDASSRGVGKPVDTSSYGDLPPYDVAVLGDRQDGATQIHIIALAYVDKDTAQKAAAELQKRIAAFDPTELFSFLGVKVDPPAVFVDKDGTAAAIVSVRYALPAGTPEPGAVSLQPGRLLKAWYNAILRRGFTPIALKITK